mmetsp:Transcript_28925/g.42891  ORF Transcript_28925/g.42891 Transcript_28925/m.42891 type:complete len:102 (-) Transcript_28925:223-528(-)
MAQVQGNSVPWNKPAGDLFTNQDANPNDNSEVKQYRITRRKKTCQRRTYTFIDSRMVTRKVKVGKEPKLYFVKIGLEKQHVPHKEKYLLSKKKLSSTHTLD